MKKSYNFYKGFENIGNKLVFEYKTIFDNKEKIDLRDCVGVTIDAIKKTDEGENNEN